MSKQSLLSALSLIIFILFARLTLAQSEDNSIVLIEQVTNQNDNRKEFVIANGNTDNNKLSLNELRAIFSLRARKWPDGTPINVFVLRDDNAVHRDFLLKTLKMLPHQLRRQWDRFIYSGIGQGPTVVSSQEEMLSKVNLTPGGIGYIEGGVSDASVHILTIY